MKIMKTKKIVKIMAFLLCVLMILPMISACGEKPDNKDSANNNTTAGNAGTEPEATPAPTDPPTEPPPTDPPTTEEPTEPFVADENLSYWEQIYSELEWFGMTGGTQIFGGEDEAALMKKFSPNNAKREELDLSGDDSVPFSAAYKVYTTKEVPNFWEASYSSSLMKDMPVEQDDLVAGVFWIKGRRTEESENFMDDDEAQYYLAIKTPTDDWATEGDMNISGVQIAGEEWQKVYFCGRIMNEEKQSSTVGLNIYIGYGIQEFEIGGLIAYWYPSTPENEKASWKLPAD